MVEIVDKLIELIEAVRWPLAVIVVALVLRKGIASPRDRTGKTSEKD